MVESSIAFGFLPNRRSSLQNANLLCLSAALQSQTFSEHHPHETTVWSTRTGTRAHPGMGRWLSPTRGGTMGLRSAQEMCRGHSLSCAGESLSSCCDTVTFPLPPKTSGEGKSKKKKKIHDQHHQMEVDINLPHMQKKNYFLLHWKTTKKVLRYTLVSIY